MKTWNFKVVKKSRGGQGEWFSHSAAATFVTFAEAKEYARKFALEQLAALGTSDSHRYCVVPRKSGGEACEFSSRWDRSVIEAQ